MAPPALTVRSAQGRWVIAATVLGSGVATLDATVVGIALPAISRSLHAGVATLQWIVTGYSITLAAFLLLGGSLGDRLGRRRIFQVGVVWFALASAACGLAPDRAVLIAARLVQGIGGALLMPGSLAILQASFAPNDRARAIGAWSALGAVAAAAGPLVGGYLLAAASWRWVFFINLPLSALVVAIAARHVPETSDPAAGPTDAPGAALAVIALAASTFALIEGPRRGWSGPAVVTGLVLAAAAVPGFIVAERRRSHPMLPLSMFAERQFAGANAVTFAMYAGLGGALFFLPVALQIVAGYSAPDAGLALLPVTVLMLAFSARSGRLAARIGPRLQMSVGPFLAGAGLVLLQRAADPGGYLMQVFPGVILFGAGLAVTVAPLTATAMGAAPPEQAGAASAVNNVVARAAGLIAVAVLPEVAGLTGARALQPAHLAGGFRTAVTVAGITCAAGGLLAAGLIRNPPPPAPAPSPRRWQCPVDGPGLHPEPAPAAIHRP
ncbi:MAG TPA: MFS transporter [Acidimicrobiales bacterium]|nr:MFS transporter [Acidimicrobiales bacterium]